MHTVYSTWIDIWTYSCACLLGAKFKVYTHNNNIDAQTCIFELSEMAMERERERHTHTYIHTSIHACMHACMHAYIYIYNITPYIIHVSEYLFINQSIYLFTFRFTHVSRLNLHPVRPSRVMPCLVDFYDCLRAWANPKSIGYPPWRKGNLDCHEPLGDVFPGWLPVEQLLGWLWRSKAMLRALPRGRWGSVLEILLVDCVLAPMLLIDLSTKYIQYNVGWTIVKRVQ